MAKGQETQWQDTQPELAKLDTVGDELIGILLDKQARTGKFGPVMAYDIQLSTPGDVSSMDEMVRIFGTAVLDDRFRKVPVGHFVKIIYEGMDEDSGAKLYKVFKGPKAPNLEEPF